MLRRVALSALVLAAAVACSDSTSPTSNPGTSSFTFTGAGGGSFSASGVPPTTQADFGTHDWAGGFLNPTQGTYEIASAHARGSGNYDIVDMIIHRTSVGTEVIDSTCTADNCNQLAFGRNLTQSDANQFDFFCVATAGSLTITEIADNRVKGTFSGSGSCIDQSFTETAFTIDGGSFDVPLVASLPQ